MCCVRDIFYFRPVLQLIDSEEEVFNGRQSGDIHISGCVYTCREAIAFSKHSTKLELFRVQCAVLDCMNHT